MNKWIWVKQETKTKGLGREKTDRDTLTKSYVHCVANSPRVNNVCLTVDSRCGCFIAVSCCWELLTCYQFKKRKQPAKAKQSAGFLNVHLKMGFLKVLVQRIISSVQFVSWDQITVAQMYKQEKEAGWKGGFGKKKGEGLRILWIGENKTYCNWTFLNNPTRLRTTNGFNTKTVDNVEKFKVLAM